MDSGLLIKVLRVLDLGWRGAEAATDAVVSAANRVAPPVRRQAEAFRFKRLFDVVGCPFLEELLCLRVDYGGGTLFASVQGQKPT